MKKSIVALAIGAAVTFAMPVMASTVSDAQPTTAAELNQPSHDVVMPVSYAKAVAQEAYLWGWPLVNQMNRRAAITQAPYPARLNDVLPVANQGQIGMLNDYIDPGQTFVTCPNQDVVYGLGFFALDKQPVVLQVPDFGDRFWVYALYDQRTNQFGHLGKQYKTKPGFYMVVGPNWKGEVPKGIEGVIKSPTAMANIIPRVFMDDTKEDRAAIQPSLNKIVVYPADKFDGKMKTMNYSDMPSVPGPKGKGETKWVVPEKFFDELPAVLKDVKPLPGEEAMYAKYNALLAAAAKDPKIKQAIVEQAKETEQKVVSQFFKWKHNGVPAGNGWNRSKNNAESGLDYYNRLGTSKSNMYDNRPVETQYFYTDNTSKGVQLDGDHNYAITFAKGQLPPVNGFWSMTLYNAEHLFSENKLHRFSLGTKNKSLQYNKDGSLTIYAGNQSPGAAKESNWLPAPSDETFSLYIRAYWGKQAILDGTWKPPVITELK